ncbi:MAG: ApaG domain-containing protein [Alphaproteobacteria bacterium]|nr:ApaG domain-containing protein [Alphaproteobacteria bacterium]
MQNTQEMVTLKSNGLVITAASELVDTRRRASGQEFLWGYYFCIENTSNEQITLIGKDWNITDSLGNNFSDSTPGFQGEIPVLEPGEYYEFCSEAPLSSDSAVFYGSCQVLRAGQKLAQKIKLPMLQFNAGQNSKRRYN